MTPQRRSPTFRPNRSSALLRRSGLGEFGAGLTLDRILGGAALCGIGFTISLFIVDLAIDDELAQNEARVGVLAASVPAYTGPCSGDSEGGASRTKAGGDGYEASGRPAACASSKATDCRCRCRAG